MYRGFPLKKGRDVTALLVILSVLLAIVGALILTQATLGVGLICLGVAFGIWARLNQAAEHLKVLNGAINRSQMPVD